MVMGPAGIGGYFDDEAVLAEAEPVLPPLVPLLDVEEPPPHAAVAAASVNAAASAPKV